LRTYQALARRPGTAEAQLCLAEILRRRGLLERAVETFSAAHEQAHLSANALLPSQALLGLGDIYRQRGQIARAHEVYEEAATRAAQLTEPFRSYGLAEAILRQARLAIASGSLKVAWEQLNTARPHVESGSSHHARLAPLLALAEGEWYLTLGESARAEGRFSEARQRAEMLQEPLLAAEALLALARTYLARSELEAALLTYTEAERQFQQLENPVGTAAATLGSAQVMIGQQRWSEAIERGETALTRFGQNEDLTGQAETLLALGLAHRNMEQLDEAWANLEAALRLYQQQGQPLGESDARYERAGVLLAQGRLDEAADELQRAIALVEQVRQTLPAPEQWTAPFMRQYAALYAQAAITEVRRNREQQARALLEAYVRLAGPHELLEQLKAYEESIPTGGEHLSEEAISANKDLQKRLRQLRKGLTS